MIDAISVLIRPWGHQVFRATKGQGLPILFLNSLGTDLRMWDGVAGQLSAPCIGMDKRGHGLSALPSAGWTLDDLVSDAVAVLDHLDVRRVLVAGCSVGGMIAQALAVREPGRVAGLFLSNTAMRMGTEESWAARIEAVHELGLAGLAPQIMERWFAPDFRSGPGALPWLTLLQRGDAAGYVGTCRVLAAADLRTLSPQIACPVLMIAGTGDLASPPELVRETASAIPGARFHLIEGAGHIPAICHPVETAALLAEFHRSLT
jgi:3-oxoadipate enol-lactonase